VDFVERIFGVAPDGGNGMLELALLLSFSIALGFLFWRKVARTFGGVDEKPGAVATDSDPER